MKIEHADIAMSSSRMYLECHEHKESLRIWVGGQPNSGAIRTDRITISPRAESLSKKCGCPGDGADLPEGMDQELFLKKLITEILSGRPVMIASLEKVTGQEASSGAERPAEPRQGWGMEYRSEEISHEREEVSFAATGIIRTLDGKEIAFSLALEMNREFLEVHRVNIRAGDAAIDPLVINFDGNAADLTNLRFSFDLDADGHTDQVPIPTEGRGFLAIDLNNDGVITNGLELFGPRTGNGFTELAAYDADSNSWIDENDPVFRFLRVMTVDSGGRQSLHALDKVGVGAIYLGYQTTQFDVRTMAENTLLGQIRSTGIYLQDDGTPGTIQQLDLVA